VIHPVPAPSLPSVPILELNCLISDIDPSHTFPVKIVRTKSVGTLRKAIMEENPESFHNGVDARSLALWNVSLADNDNFEENVGKFECVDEEALKPMTILNQIFPEPPEVRHLHIIVRLPPPSEF
jgi:hypothetical protein